MRHMCLPIALVATLLLIACGDDPNPTNGGDSSTHPDVSQDTGSDTTDGGDTSSDATDSGDTRSNLTDGDAGPNPDAGQDTGKVRFIVDFTASVTERKSFTLALDGQVVSADLDTGVLTSPTPWFHPGQTEGFIDVVAGEHTVSVVAVTLMVFCSGASCNESDPPIDFTYETSLTLQVAAGSAQVVVLRVYPYSPAPNAPRSLRGDIVAYATSPTRAPASGPFSGKSVHFMRGPISEREMPVSVRINAPNCFASAPVNNPVDPGGDAHLAMPAAGAAALGLSTEGQPYVYYGLSEVGGAFMIPIYGITTAAAASGPGVALELTTAPPICR